jgi:hypothetical protein
MVQTDHIAPRMDNNLHVVNNSPRRARPTCLDVFANSALLAAVLIWPSNVFLEFTGDLCHSTTSKAIFCGVPAAALFILWIAMFQEKGYWATSREGKTEERYKRVRKSVLLAMFAFVCLVAIVLWQAMFWICRDGCADGLGDGRKCIKNTLSRVH